MKPIDLSKFQKTITKSLDNISVGFTDPKVWIHTGNYALNYRVSGDFKKGFPLEGKMTLLGGESGSCKSFIASGNIVKWCQDNNVLPIIIDTENALDEKWMRNFGIDPNGYIMKISASLLDDIAKVMSDFLKTYKDDYKDCDYDDKPKVLFIIDSLGMAITPTDEEQFNKGDMKGDLGRKQKQIYSICRNFLASCGNEPIGLLCTQHTYASQDIFSPDAIISGGRGLEFTPSVIIVLNKRKLKEDENGVKTSEVKGVKVDAMVRKTRYTQPFQKITESLTYNGNPIISKEGAYCSYYDLKTGEKVWKKYRKEITNEDYDRIMNDYMEVTASDVNNDVNDTKE
jgi:RecA/RadA recombinase